MNKPDDRPAAGSGRYSDLPLRVVSAVALAAFALWCTWMGGETFLLLVTVFSALIYFEFTGMVRSQLPRRIMIAGALFLLLLFASYLVARPASGLVIAAAGVCLVALWELAVRRSVWGASALLYAGLPFVSLVDMRNGDHGLFIVLFVFACVWGADSFAYFAGKGIGGPKLAPRISPNKTWAGFIGGFVGAVVVSALVEIAFGYPLAASAFVLALALALFSQAGDLFESWVKRRFGVKDSGKIIPGHGGVLDRIDGFIFAISLAWLIALAVSPGDGSQSLTDAFAATFFDMPR